ncbi:Lrp/AsnC ligand binding domain-containing protein [Streptomyces sp. NPDC001093]|uniref:Lrp/AsnC family transcriptional regulator n=1 Tax=Streptomyces sp. NPDC001093 TaxID=3154376 RepID=UPI0033315D0C
MWRAGAAGPSRRPPARESRPRGASDQRAALNRGVQALVSVQARPLNRTVIDTFKGFAGSLPEVLHVFVLSGGDDFLLHVAVPDLDRLHSFLVDRLSKRAEITGLRASMIFRQVGNTAALARLPS